MSDYTPSIKIDIQPVGEYKDYRLVTFVGNLDKAGLDAVRNQIEEVVDTVKDERYVAFNFENLEFINSESIGFLLMLHTRLVKKQKKLAIVHAVEHVKDVLDVIGMLKIIEYFPSLEDFQKSL